ncbi:MAG: hypothetical protein JRH20_17815, partial [Deltaproteobacteria bacterium]|nr:hypothetical protein [Deltaproteobacteria bacterium]
ILYRELIDASYVQGSDVRRMTAREVGSRLRELVLGRPRLRQLIDELKLFQKIVDNRSHIEAQDELRKRITFRLGGGDTIHISFIGPTAEVAQKVTARLAALVLAEDKRIRSEQAQRTVRFLEGERKRAEDHLSGREKTLAQFLASHPEFAADEYRTAGAAVRAKTRKQKPGAPISARGIMKRQMRRIRDQLAQAQGRKPVVVRDPKLQAAKARADGELNEAKAHLRRLSGQFTDRHPDVQSARARVNLAKAQLRRIIERAKAATKIVDVGGKAEAALKERLSEIRRQISGYQRRSAPSTDGKSGPKGDSTADQIVALETDWTRMNREVQEARERYIRIETRSFQASLAATSKVQGVVGNMRIIDPAYLPKRPAGAGRTKLVFIGGAASVFLALGLVFGLALIDERIYSSKDAERLRIAEVLSVVPTIKRGFFGRKLHRRFLRKMRRGKTRRR